MAMKHIKCHKKLKVMIAKETRLTISFLCLYHSNMQPVKVLEMITSLPGAKLKEEKIQSSTAENLDSRNVWTSFSR